MSANFVKNSSGLTNTSETNKLVAVNKWRRLFWATRTRILMWYLLIITFIFLVSIPAFRLLLFARVDERVRRDLVEKIQTFNWLVENEAEIEEVDKAKSEEIPDYDWLREADTSLVSPSSQEDLKQFFDTFLAKQLPEDETFLITFVDGKFYKSSPRARPKIFDRDSKLMNRWAKLVKPEKGEQELPQSELGGIIYMSQPVEIEGETLGVFVVVHTVSGERQEVVEAVGVIVQVSVLGMIAALLLAWVASAKVLAPLRWFTATARSISESDLSQRIPVHAKDELADMATTFNEMMDRLEASFSTQRNFINDAGHELKTPISIVRGHLELMDDNNPEEINETVALVFDELDRISRFVEDLILLVKAERLDFLKLELVDIENLSLEFFNKAKALATRNWCLDKTGKGKVVLDRQRLTQAMMNLAQNAVQHTITPDTIAIGSSISEGEVKFWVRDTGEGINLADQQIIFERFARASNSRAGSNGTGLGLSIVKVIAQAHHGEVIVDSLPGKGATFSIFLPVRE